MQVRVLYADGTDRVLFGDANDSEWFGCLWLNDQVIRDINDIVEVRVG